MKAADSFAVQLTDEALKPLRMPGVFLTVNLYLHGKYRFGFRTPPSDSSGIVSINYNDLETSRRRNLEIQPADFKTRLEECDSTLIVEMPPKDELLRAADTLDTMGQGRYPDLATAWRKCRNGHVKAEHISIDLASEKPVYAMQCQFQTEA